jgi:hypothetical protein
MRSRILWIAALLLVAGAELTFDRGGAASSVTAGPDSRFRFAPCEL